MLKRISIRAKVVLAAVMVLTVVCVTITVGIVSVSRGRLLVYDVERTESSGEMGRVVEDGSTTIFSGNIDQSKDFSESEDEEKQEFVMTENLIAEASGVMTGIMIDAFWIMLVSLLVGTAAIWLIVGKALRPLTRFSEAISEIDEKKLNQPLELPKSQDEVADMTKSFNCMLERLNHSFEVQKRFSATAAHELKTPISSIISNVEVLELDEHPSCDEYQETIAVVKENAFRMEQLVLDLLTSYSTGMVLKKEACNLRTICEKCCKACSEADRNGIVYEITGEQTVEGDSLLLERAVGNLISNAFRYNHPGGTVTVDMGENQLTVSDTGVGIPEEDLEKIFEPFYRVDMSRSRELGGSGLGLAIVKNILDAHNANIAVDSIEGEGTIFTIHFEMQVI